MKPSDFVILLDMDDVLVNLCECWVNELNERHNTSVNPLDIKSWSMYDYFPTLSKEEIYAPLSDIGMWSKVAPKQGAQECVKRLISKGYQVYVVTAAHHSTIMAKVELALLKHFPYIDYQHIITSFNKQMIKGDILIDDNPLNLMGGEYKPILMNASHNESFDNEKYNIHRFDGWSEELFNYINNLYEEKHIDNYEKNERYDRRFFY